MQGSVAQNTILAVSKTPRQRQVSSFWAVLTDRISNGVLYHRIVDLDEIIDHGLKIVRRDTQDYKINILVLEQDEIKHKFYIVDDRFLALFHQDDMTNSAERRGVGRITTQRQIIARYQNKFEKYLRSAIPAPFVLNIMEQAANSLVNRASSMLQPVEIAWLKDLVDYGKFSKFHLQENWSNEALARLVQKAILHGLVSRNYQGDIIPHYLVTERDLRNNYNKTCSLSDSLK
jgi:hypothetical protein